MRKKNGDLQNIVIVVEINNIQELKQLTKTVVLINSLEIFTELLPQK